MPLSQIQLSSSTGRRNLAINGDMKIAQRGAGPTQAGNGNYITVDRMMHWSYPSGTGTFTSTQSSGHQLQTGHEKAFKIDVTAADTSIGAADYYEILQRIEGKNIQHLRWGTAAAKKLQVSFWVRATKTGVNALFCSKQGTGTDYRNVVEYTINASDTWEHKTVEFPALTASTIAFDNSTYIQIGWPLAMGSNFQNGTAGTWTTNSFYSTANSVNHMDSTSNDFYITGLQVEVGDTATEFEHRSFGEELALCQRYFERMDDEGNSSVPFGVGYNESTSQARGMIFFKTIKRVDPTISISAASSFCNVSTGSTAAASTLTFDSQLPWGVRYICTSSNSTLVDGGASVLQRFQNDATIEIDSEL